MNLEALKKRIDERKKATEIRNRIELRNQDQAYVRPRQNPRGRMEEKDGVYTFPGMDTEETRRTIEGPGESLEEDLAIPIILGAAAVPIVGPAIGAGPAIWKTATTLGRITHGVADAAAAIVAEYGAIQPLARHAGEIHPYLRPIVEIVGGVSSAITIEQLAIESFLKSTTKIAPNFWSDQLGAFVKKGFLPSAHADDLADVAKHADKGDVGAMKTILNDVREEAYNRHLEKSKVKIEAAEFKALQKRRAQEPSEQVIKELTPRTATGGNLTYTELLRLSKAAERDAIFEYHEEFIALKSRMVTERTNAAWAEIPQRDFIDTLIADTGITEKEIRAILKKSPDDIPGILKKLKAHKGLITDEGGANLMEGVRSSDTKDLETFVRQLADTRSKTSIQRQKSAELDVELNRIYQDEIYLRTHQKQSEFLRRVLGESPSTKARSTESVVKEVASGKSSGRVIAELVRLRETVNTYSKMISKELVAKQKAKGKDSLDSLRAKHKEALKALQVRMAAKKEATSIAGYLQRSTKVPTMLPDYREQLSNFLKPLFTSRSRTTPLQLPENMFQFLTRKYQDELSFGTDLLLDKYNNLVQSFIARPPRIKNLTLDQLRDVQEFVKAYRFVATNEKYIMQEAHKIWINGKVNEVATTAKLAVPQSPFSKKSTAGVIDYSSPDRFKAVTDLKNGSLASLKRMEFITRQLDGWEDFGTAWTYIFKPMKDAEALSHRLGEQVFNSYKRILGEHKMASGMGRNAGKYWSNTTTQLGDAVYSKEQAVVMAFHMGNRESTNALLSHINGRVIKDAEDYIDADAISDWLKTNLTKADFKFVDDIHKFMDKEIFPLLSKTYREVTGLRLQRVKGKYYPIVPENYYKDSQRGTDLLDVLMGLPTKNRADLNKSMVMNRYGGVTRINMELDSLIKHLRDSVHLSTHWKALQDVQNFTRKTNFREAVTNTMGEDIYAQFDPWLRNIARPSSLDPAHRLMERSMRYMRGATSVAVLGMNTVTAAKQSLSLVTALPEIGVANAMGSIMKMMKNPVSFLRGVSAASPEMQYRVMTWQREISEMMQAGVGREVGLRGHARNAWFYMIHTVDRMTASIVWHGGYLKGLDKFEGNAIKAAELADMLVKKTQPASSPKDLPKVMRSGETSKFISMFYGYFSVWHNQVGEVWSKGLAKNISKTEMYSTLAFLVAAPVVAWQTMATGANILARREVEPEDVATELGKKLAVAPFAGVPILRDLMSSAIMGYDPKLTPVAQIMEDATVTANTFRKAMDDDEEVSFRDATTAARLAGYFLHVPSNAMITTVEGLIRLAEGDTDDITELVTRPKWER